MTYATLQNLIDRYGKTLLVKATDRAELATGEIDMAVVNRALANADALINGSMHRYKMPLAQVPPLLVDLAESIAIYKIHRFEPDPKIKDEYADALRVLKQIADGTSRLPIEGVEPQDSGSNGVMITDRERPLTEANMKAFI